MTQFSRKIKYLSTTSSEKRDGILKQNIDDLEDGESAFLKSAIDYYEQRPSAFEDMTLGKIAYNHLSNLIIVADFWSRYEIVYRGGNEEEEPTDDNFDEESETVKRKLPTFQLKVAFLSLHEIMIAVIGHYSTVQQ